MKVVTLIHPLLSVVVTFWAGCSIYVHNLLLIFFYSWPINNIFWNLEPINVVVNIFLEESVPKVISKYSLVSVEVGCYMGARGKARDDRKPRASTHGARELWSRRASRTQTQTRTHNTADRQNPMSVYIKSKFEMQLGISTLSIPFSWMFSSRRARYTLLVWYYTFLGDMRRPSADVYWDFQTDNIRYWFWSCLLKLD